MSNPFKVGDVVKCVEGVGTTLITGRIYTIADVPAGEYVGVSEVGDGWDYSRFVLIKPPLPGIDVSTKRDVTSITLVLSAEEARYAMEHGFSRIAESIKKGLSDE